MCYFFNVLFCAIFSSSNNSSKATSPELDTSNSMSNTTDSLISPSTTDTLPEESNQSETQIQAEIPPSILPYVTTKSFTPTTIDTQLAELTSSDLPKAAISPILSQPKTIRFPATSGLRCGPKGAKRNDGVCYWDKCNKKHDSSSKLLDHMQTQHVNSQTGPFACLWVGCKVYNKESCSRRWLERHVLSHGGSKQFKCIVEGCGLRFGSQVRSNNNEIILQFISSDIIYYFPDSLLYKNTLIIISLPLKTKKVQTNAHLIRQCLNSCERMAKSYVTDVNLSQVKDQR